MTIPDFILAGTMPAGTGQLYVLLDAHPLVRLAKPMQPECNFFAKTNLYRMGSEHYLSTWFNFQCEADQVCGERSSLLMSATLGPERVAQAFPNIKLVFMLRDPVERAFANYRFTSLCGFEELSFEDALEAEEQRAKELAPDSVWHDIRPHAYLERSLYAAQIDRWRDHFPESQLMWLRSDSLQDHSSPVFSQICSFLGIDASAVQQAGPAPRFSSPSVIDPKRQAQLRLEYSSDFDQGIQRLRHGSKAENSLDLALRENMADTKARMSESVILSLRKRLRNDTLKFRSKLPFSVDDWL